MTHTSSSPAHAEWLEAAEAVGPLLREQAQENERLRRLAPTVVSALHAHKLFSIFSPLEVGGASLGPLGHTEVIAALTSHDAASGWCVMIGAHESAWLTSRLPEAALDVLFDAPHWPVAAGSPTPNGAARPVEGGWRIDGRWGWASGIDHADWVIAQAPPAGAADRPPGAPPELITVAVPRDAVEVEDTWWPAGLAGTGSSDYRIDDLFVGADFRLQPFELPPRRGEGWVERPTITFLCPAAYGLAQGLAQRAVEESAALAASRVRVGQRAPLAEREVFQRELGECAAALQAIENHGARLYAQLAEAPVRGVDDVVAMDDSARAAAAWATRTAESIIRTAHRAAGGDAVFLDHPLQRLLRDVQTASQHVVVSDSTFIRLGQHKLGIPVRPGL